MGVEGGSSGRRSDGGRPALDPHHLRAIAVPDTWPEVVAYEAGMRLAIAEHDEVPMMLRSGLPIDHLLHPEQITAHVLLGDRAFERWFRLGWARAAGDEEG